jgi:hypothetical protein
MIGFGAYRELFPAFETVERRHDQDPNGARDEGVAGL